MFFHRILFLRFLVLFVSRILKELTRNSLTLTQLLVRLLLFKLSFLQFNPVSFHSLDTWYTNLHWIQSDWYAFRCCGTFVGRGNRVWGHRSVRYLGKDDVCIYMDHCVVALRPSKSCKFKLRPEIENLIAFKNSAKIVYRGPKIVVPHTLISSTEKSNVRLTNCATKIGTMKSNDGTMYPKSFGRRRNARPTYGRLGNPINRPN